MLGQPLDEPVDPVDHVDGHPQHHQLEVPGGAFGPGKGTGPTGCGGASDRSPLPHRRPSARPQDGHVSPAAMSGGFQNLLQSSHHGNGHGLHAQQAMPVGRGNGGAAATTDRRPAGGQPVAGSSCRLTSIATTGAWLVARKPTSIASPPSGLARVVIVARWAVATALTMARPRP